MRIGLFIAVLAVVAGGLVANKATFLPAAVTDDPYAWGAAIVVCVVAVLWGMLKATGVLR